MVYGEEEVGWGGECTLHYSKVWEKVKLKIPLPVTRGLGLSLRNYKQTFKDDLPTLALTD